MAKDVDESTELVMVAQTDEPVRCARLSKLSSLALASEDSTLHLFGDSVADSEGVPWVPSFERLPVTSRSVIFTSLIGKDYIYLSIAAWFYTEP